MKEMKVKIKRKKTKRHLTRVVDEIKNGTTKIIFKAENFFVTLRNKEQLKRWLDKYPEGQYEIKCHV